MLFDNKQSKFESLVRAYSTELYRYAHWLCRDHFMAEDIVQETFTRAWQGLSGLRDAKAVKGWLYTILRGASMPGYMSASDSISMITRNLMTLRIQAASALMTAWQCATPSGLCVGRL